MSKSCKAEASVDWDTLLHGIISKSDSAIARFHEIFTPGVRAHIARRIWNQNEVEACAAECLGIAVASIQEDQLLEPERVGALVLSILRNVKTLEFYALNRLPVQDLGRIEEHLLICETCRDRLNSIGWENLETVRMVIHRPC